MLDPINLLNGHRLVDCGTGDHILECPVHGITGGWMHWGMVIQALQNNCICSACQAGIWEASALMPEQAAHVSRIAQALERIADAMEREAPKPDEHEEGLTPVGELMLDGSRV